MTKDEFLTCLVRQAGGAKPLSREEEQRLGNMIKHGTSGWKRFAIDKLVLHNVRYVILEARKLLGYGHDLNDMVQDGVLGLAEAAEKFDPDFGNKFISYARWNVLQRIQRGIGNNSRPVKLPDNTLGAMHSISKAVEKFYGEGEPHPEVAAVAGETGVHPSLAQGGLIIKMDHTALDESPFAHRDDQEGGLSRKERLPDEAADTSAGAEASSDQRAVAGHLGRLTARQELVLRMRFGIGYEKPYTLKEVGDHLGVTRSRAEQIEKESLDKLIRKSDIDELLELGEPLGVGASGVHEAKERVKARDAKRNARNRKDWAAYSKKQKVLK